MDAAVQTPFDASTGRCRPEDILRETMEGHARIPLFLKKASVPPLLRKGQQLIPYSVDSHFSRFEDIDTVASSAAGLGAADLRCLADRFLGTHVAGVAIERRNERPKRRVSDRYVAEAAFIVQRAPAFRAALLRSSRNLLLRGLQQQPLNRRSLFDLAYAEAAPTEENSDHHPAHKAACSRDTRPWALLTQVALDFAGRLMQAGALPQSFAAELLEAAAQLPIAGTATCSAPAKGHPALGLAAVISVVTRARADSTGSWLQPEPEPPRLSRSGSSGDSVSRASRSVSDSASSPGRGHARCAGTSLHLHDDKQPYCKISVEDEGAWHELHGSAAAPGRRLRRAYSTHDEACQAGPPPCYGALRPRTPSSYSGAALADTDTAAVEAAWRARWLADYWRFAAGGEHPPERLEQLAREAEKEAWVCVAVHEEASSPMRELSSP